MRAIVNYKAVGGTNPAGNYNNIPFTATLGILSADLIDFDTGLATGIGLELITAFVGGTSTTIVNADSHGYAKLAWDHSWYTNVTSTLKFTGLTAGHNYTLKATGANVNVGRHADFTIGAITNRYINSADLNAPTAPISFSGTVDGSGEIVIDTDLVSVWAYLNIMELEVTSPPQSITAITDPVLDGSTGNTFSVSGFAGDIIAITVKDNIAGTHSLSGVITSGSGDGPYGFNIPAISGGIGCPLDSPYWGHIIEVTDGVTTAEIPVVYSKKAGWEVVDIGVSPINALGYLFYGWATLPIQYDQVYYPVPVGEGNVIDESGHVETDKTSGSISLFIFDQGDSTWKSDSILIADITKNKLLNISLGLKIGL